MTLKENEFYCLRCKKHVEAKKGSICKAEYTTKRGKKGFLLKGVCPCPNNCKLSKLISEEKNKTFKDKYSDCPEKSKDTSSDCPEKSKDTSSDTSVAEVGGVFALLALLAGGIAVTIKSLKQC